MLRSQIKAPICNFQHRHRQSDISCFFAVFFSSVLINRDQLVKSRFLKITGTFLLPPILQVISASNKRSLLRGCVRDAFSGTVVIQVFLVDDWRYKPVNENGIISVSMIPVDLWNLSKCIRKLALLIKSRPKTGSWSPITKIGDNRKQLHFLEITRNIGCYCKKTEKI